MHYTVLLEHNILTVFWRRTTRISGRSEKKLIMQKICTKLRQNCN